VRTSLRAADEGSVAAEFALAMPAVVVMLALVLGAVQLAVVRIHLQDAAAVTARSLARGDTAPAHEGSTMTTAVRGDLVCVRLNHRAVLLRIPVSISASSCALNGGR
jgi:Flp pilus assembly protein TadG